MDLSSTGRDGGTRSCISSLSRPCPAPRARWVERADPGAAKPRQSGSGSWPHLCPEVQAGTSPAEVWESAEPRELQAPAANTRPCFRIKACLPLLVGGSIVTCLRSSSCAPALGPAGGIKGTWKAKQRQTLLALLSLGLGVSSLGPRGRVSHLRVRPGLPALGTGVEWEHCYTRIFMSHPGLR